MTFDGGSAPYETFREAYEKGDVHPADLKRNLTTALIEILNPVHSHFSGDEKAMELQRDVRAMLSCDRNTWNQTPTST